MLFDCPPPPLDVQLGPLVGPQALPQLGLQAAVDGAPAERPVVAQAAVHFDT